MVLKVNVDPSRNWAALPPDSPIDPTTGLPADLPVNRLQAAVPAPAKTIPSFLSSRQPEFAPPPVTEADYGEDADLQGYQAFDPASIADPRLESQQMADLYRSQIAEDEDAKYRQMVAGGAELAGRPQYHQMYDNTTGELKNVPIGREEYQQARLSNIAERPDIPMELAGNIHEIGPDTVSNLQELGTYTPSTFFDSRKHIQKNLIESRNSTKAMDFSAHRNEIARSIEGDASMAPVRDYLAEHLPIGMSPLQYDTMLNIMAAASMMSMKPQRSLKAEDEVTNEPLTGYERGITPEEQHSKAIQHYLANARSRIPGADQILTSPIMKALPAIITAFQVDNNYLEKVTNKKTGEMELRKTSLASDDNILGNLEIAQVLAEDYLRLPASTVPVSSIPGLTAPSKGVKGSGKQDISQVVIDHLGNMGEYVKVTHLQDTIRQWKDILENYNEELGYSTSIWADRKGFGKAKYDSLMSRFKRERDPSTNKPLYSEEEHKERARKHVLDALWGTAMDDTGIESARQKMERSIKYGGMISSKNRPVYTGRIRDPLNQRMYRDRAMTDVGADKVGLRDMLSPFAQEGLGFKYLFDDAEILKLQSRLGKYVDGKLKVPYGRKFSEWYNRTFTKEEQVALEYMAEATRQSLHDQKQEWDNVPWEELILRYKLPMGNLLADRGVLLQRWRNGETGSDIDENNKLLADIDKGEWLAYAAFWDDLANIRSLKGTARKHQLTTVFNDDGTQNGVFLQAVFSGLQKEAALLGSPGGISAGNEPWSGEDLRKILWDTVYSASAKVGITPDLQHSWDQFFNAIETNSGSKLRNVLNLFGKAALMQYAYGKDAAMFSEQMTDFLDEMSESNNQAYNDLLSQYNEAKKTDEDMLKDLTRIMGNSLKVTVSPGFTNTNKKLGLGFSWLDYTPTIRGAANDDYEFGQRFLGVQNLGEDLNKLEQLLYSDDEGNQQLGMAVERQPSAFAFGESGNVIRELGFSKSTRAIKPVTYFYDRKKQQYQEYKQFVGQGFSNQLGVMPIQCMDGDLLKLMILHANIGRETPLYVDTVHDAIRTTAGSRIHYINAYNNIAIPQITKWMETYRQQMVESYFDARKQTIENVKNKNIPVMIGLNGKHAAVGAFIDAQYDKFYGPNADDYKERMVAEYGEKAYLRSKERNEVFIRDAKKLGWIPKTNIITSEKTKHVITDPETINRFRDNMAVTPNNFEKLIELLEKAKNINHTELEFWARKGPMEVKAVLKHLINNQQIGRFGIYQLGKR